MGALPTLDVLTMDTTQPDVPAVDPAAMAVLQLSQENIINAWDMSVSGGETSYADWFRRLCRVHLRESPSPSLRACSLVAERYVVRACACSCV